MTNKILNVKGISKVYGPTIAVNNLDFELYAGEVVGLIGANGAGKSTLIKLISGVVPASSGSLEIFSELVLKNYNSSEAISRGIRVVHQELSLCKNLTVYENFYIEQKDIINSKRKNWRDAACDFSKKALDKIFPENNINVKSLLENLSIAEQQMVEIARALTAKNAKIFILDEPTSSLPKHETEQLLRYIKNESSTSNDSFIYITHRFKEIEAISNRIFLMQNGRKKFEGKFEDLTEDEIVRLMSDNELLSTNSNSNSEIIVDSKSGFENNQENSSEPEENLIEINNLNTNKLSIDNLSFKRGEIVSITGLEGNGQKDLLDFIYYESRKKHLKNNAINIKGSIAYVAGDRKKEGIFPLWSINKNTVISSVSNNHLYRYHTKNEINKLSNFWNNRLNTKSENYNQQITQLSGGNQQKVLIARALAVDADIIILDDPTRGVDLGTKQELYDVFSNAAKSGKLIIWSSSEDTELKYADRIVVMKNGSVNGIFSNVNLDYNEILKLSFQEDNKSQAIISHKEAISQKKKHTPALYRSSLIGMLILFFISVYFSPGIASKFGLELLTVGFTPFLFGALAQTFIIGLGHIDLSIGAFMGLINVVCATILFENTIYGIIVMLALLAVYISMGLMIYWKNIPPMIASLSMSFVWMGFSYILQDVPGGKVPQWMLSLFNFPNPITEGIILWLAIFIIIAVLIYKSRLGVVLRGFGNNENAMINSGWSRIKTYFIVYFLAGIYSIMGGVAQSVITGASDVNASATYTMLTVAAVIIGGGSFSGGKVTYIGTIFGGIILTLVNILLGLMSVSTDYTATVQGLVLILILSIRLFRQGITHEKN